MPCFILNSSLIHSSHAATQTTMLEWKIEAGGRRVFGGGGGRTTQPPNPPFSAPTRTKRVQVCSFFNSAPIYANYAYNMQNHQNIKYIIFMQTHHDLKPICCRVMGYGAKTEIRMPMYTWPTRHPQLACTAPHCFHNYTDYLMLAQSWKFGVNCCFIGLTHPAAWTQARVPLTLEHVHKPPLLPNLLKKGGNRVGLSWGFRWFI